MILSRHYPPPPLLGIEHNDPSKGESSDTWSKNQRLDIIPSSFVLVFHLRIDNLENFLRSNKLSKIDEKKKDLYNFHLYNDENNYSIPLLRGIDKRGDKNSITLYVDRIKFAFLHQNRILSTNGSDTFRG